MSKTRFEQFYALGLVLLRYFQQSICEASQWTRRFRAKLFYFCLSLLVSFAIAGWTVEAHAVRIPIFGFHDLIDVENSAEMPPQRLPFPADFSKQDLDKFLNYLVRENYWFLSSQDLYAYFIKKSQPIPKEHLGQKTVMLTFDDGYLGVHSNGMPILENLENKYGKKVKFVLFVNPLTMGTNIEAGYNLPHVSCEDLREGYQKGYYDVQSHGFSHKNLTKLNDKDLEFELSEAKKRLRICLGELDRNKIVSAHIAYPYGSLNRKVEKRLPFYYVTGYLYDDNLLQVNRLRNYFQIPRLSVNRFTSTQQLIAIAQRSSKLSRRH